jgi:hypothetical protein
MTLASLAYRASPMALASARLPLASSRLRAEGAEGEKVARYSGLQMACAGFFFISEKETSKGCEASSGLQMACAFGKGCEARAIGSRGVQRLQATGNRRTPEFAYSQEARVEELYILKREASSMLGYKHTLEANNKMKLRFID